jgi:hypothetical protein
MLDFPPKYLPSNIYIFNMSEDVWPFICAMSDKKKQVFEIDENANSCDRDFFTCSDEDNTLFIFPKNVPEVFLSYYTKLFDKKNIRVVVPKHHSGVICEDVIQDDAVMDAIMKAANGSKRLVMRSYTTSQQFIDLVQLLKDKGLIIFTPDAPEEEDSWTINFFGSKSGIRQLAQQSKAAEPDFMMPEGHIVMGIVDTAKIAAKKYINEHGVVLKTNKGHSGAGVLIFREGDLPSTYEECEIAILSLLKRDAYWNMFPIVVESFVIVNSSIGGGYPNVEFQILKNGHVEFLYYCGMRVSDQGVFKGVEIHNEVLSDHVSARIVDTGFYIGEQYRAAGYRGYFDVDFVAARNGQLYVTESNVRRTGGTHVYEVAMRLFGKDFLYTTYILSNNAYQLPKEKPQTAQSLLGVLEPIFFDKKKKEGIIIASVNMLAQQEFGYIVFGENKRRAYEIEQEMETLLQS